MADKQRRPGVEHRGDVDDQHRAGEVNTTKGSRITRPPTSVDVALDHLDDAGLCCCWTSPNPRRCKRVGESR